MSRGPVEYKVWNNIPVKIQKENDGLWFGEACLPHPLDELCKADNPITLQRVLLDTVYRAMMVYSERCGWKFPKYDGPEE